MWVSITFGVCQKIMSASSSRAVVTTIVFLFTPKPIFLFLHKTNILVKYKRKTKHLTDTTFFSSNQLQQNPQLSSTFRAYLTIFPLPMVSPCGQNTPSNTYKYCWIWQNLHTTPEVPMNIALLIYYIHAVTPYLVCYTRCVQSHDYFDPGNDSTQRRKCLPIVELRDTRGTEERCSTIVVWTSEMTTPR